jgi:hypothetical protein
MKTVLSRFTLRVKPGFRAHPSDSRAFASIRGFNRRFKADFSIGPSVLISTRFKTGFRVVADIRSSSEPHKAHVQFVPEELIQPGNSPGLRDGK